MKLSTKKIKELKKISTRLRINILNAIFKVKKGHIGGSFSCIDILVCIYISNIFNFKKINFQKKINDFFILSKGHSALALYSVLDYLKISKNYSLNNFHKPGSLLMEHPSPNIKLPGIEIETGSLGNGLGVGTGIAFSNKKNNKKTIVLVGDGELYEGSNWEAMLVASHFKLRNLLVLVDRNFSITLDKTESIMKLENLKKKFMAFGFKTIVVDGHNYLKLLTQLQKFKIEKSEKPTCIICKTKKGKGSIVLESDLKFHHNVPNKIEYKNILKNLGVI
jgi:transketolase